ncbi:helix-turn-helix domain-containing protein [Labilibacter marinus]|uniref:helix-turn-helix domain-containing protein n=1 Tax=Labilibacter marinus TaxID=1477105 RepID=UPI00094FD732|nr:helix-turn-helix domain-containing protein [Labilibacter marinus]
MDVGNMFNIVLLLGAIFSILLSFYLFFYPSNFFANKVLGVLTFSWAITDFAFMIQSPDFFAKYPHFFLSLDIFTLMFFPLMYIYIRTYLYEDARKVKKNIMHFIPAICHVIVFMPFFLIGTEEKALMIQSRSFPRWLMPLQLFFNLVIIGQGIIYSILSLRKLHHFQYFRMVHLTRYQLNSLKWLRNFVIVNIILWLIGTAGIVIDGFQVDINVDLFAVFYLGLTVLTIVLGIFTIKRPEFFAEEEDIVKYVFNKPAAENRKIEEVKLSDKDILLAHFEKDKPYLKPDLKMQDIVDSTGFTYKRISEILNVEFQKSFFDIINDYRMKAVIGLIHEGFHKQHTLPHLAEQAGFNSKTSFNRIFKKYTGKTPTEYIQNENL